MNGASLTQLIRWIGPAHVTGFFLVLARVSPLFLLAPLFSSKMLPAQARGTAAVGISIGLTGVVTRSQQLAADPLQLAALIVENVLVGLAFAFAVGAVFAAVQAAGALTDSVAGFSFGSQIDPVNGNPGGTVTQLYGLIGVAMFLAIGGDAWVLRGMARTFDLVPLTRGPALRTLVDGVETAFGSIFVAALEVAAPAILAVMITDTALGMVSRVVPQLNVFSVAFPVKIGVALLIVGASMPFIAGWMSDQLVNAVGIALHTI